MEGTAVRVGFKANGRVSVWRVEIWHSHLGGNQRERASMQDKVHRLSEALWRKPD